MVPAIGQKVQDGLSLVQERYVVWVERIYLRGHMVPAIAPVPRYHNSWVAAAAAAVAETAEAEVAAAFMAATAAMAAMAVMAAIAAAEAVSVAATAASSRQD